MCNVCVCPQVEDDEDDDDEDDEDDGDDDDPRSAHAGSPRTPAAAGGRQERVRGPAGGAV